MEEGIAEVAGLLAELDLCERPEELLRARGLDPAGWQDQLETLGGALADEVDRGEVLRAEAFTQAYADARARLGVPLPESAGAVFDAAPVAPVGAVPGAAAVAAPVAAPTAAPIATATAAPPPVVARPAANLTPERTLMPNQLAIAVAQQNKGVPFQSDPSKPPPAPLIADPHEQAGETQEIDAKAVHARLAALGVVVGQRGAVDLDALRARAAAAPAAPRPAPEPGGTAFLAPGGASHVPALPFEGNRADANQRPSAPAHAASAEHMLNTVLAIEAPPPQSPPGTGTEDMHAPAAATSLPFHAAEPGADPRAAATRAAAASPASPARRPTSEAEAIKNRATAAVDVTELRARIAAGATPFGIGAEPLDVDKLARIQTELSQAPDRDAVLKTHGYDTARWQAVLRRFGEAMKTDPQLRARYEELLKRGNR